MKAQTAALKYCYLLSLAIATGDDPEADTATDESTATTVKNPAKNTLICHDCGAEISQKVADYSKSKFGKFLCFNCQKSQNAA